MKEDILFDCIKKIIFLNFEKNCVSLLLSKGLSVILIIISFTSKIPQISSMFREKNIKGLNSISIFSDITIFVFASSYCLHMKYPILSYGECLIILFENIIIFLLFWKYKKEKYSNIKNIIFSIIIILFLFLGLGLDIYNEKIWKITYSSTFSLTCLSRFSQLYSSYKAKSTGPLSAFNFLYGVCANLIRIFTSIKETGDSMLIFNYFVNSILNFTVFLQIIYYNKYNVESNKKKIV